MKLANVLSFAAPIDQQRQAQQNVLAAQPATPAQGGNALSYAAGNLGMDENTQHAALQDYLKTGGVNLDPATTAWCAAFVNASLSHAGLQGTGSNMAQSFLKWGTGVDTPQQGDIGVLPRGAPGSGLGHVGFVAGVNPDGSIRLLSGNSGDKVQYSNYPAAEFLGFRRGQAKGVS